MCGEHRFLGLYGSRAYSRLPQEIPLLRRKVAYVSERADLDRDSHSGKALVHILETYPRDELFQIAQEDLYRIAMGIMELAEEQRPRLFMRQDPYGRFIACLVYAPRERYDTGVRERMQGILEEALAGTEVEFTVNVSESALARILFIVRTRPGAIPDYDPREIEARLADAVQSWKDRLQAGLREHLGEERGSALFLAYGRCLPGRLPRRFPGPHRSAGHRAFGAAGLRERAWHEPVFPAGVSTRAAQVQGVSPRRDTTPVAGPAHPGEHGGRGGGRAPLPGRASGSAPLWVHDFGLAYEGEETPDRGEVRELFQDAFAMVWRGRAENDGFNRLVIKARLDWRRIALIRAYAKYLRQTGMTFSQAYMEEAAAANPDIVALLVELFEVRFDPQRRKQAAQQATRLVTKPAGGPGGGAEPGPGPHPAQLPGRCPGDLAHQLVQTGPDGSPKEHIALKLNSGEIPDLPQPRPAFEVFVYSPRMEGVHLRGGKVARGGLRWSDRREDFRTEVLGLMKAQMVKNAVIVPVGAKGGFVVKHPPAERAALREEVVACYRQFISGLLDLTDNLARDHCLAAAGPGPLRRRRPLSGGGGGQGDRHLLRHANEVAPVTASGWATPSPPAAPPATTTRRWASPPGAPGSASGSTSSPPRSPTNGSPFTVVGIGDMSGDVFGNGMLLSRQHQAGRGLRSPPHLHRPGPGPGSQLRRAQTAVRAARLQLGGLRPRAHLRGRRRLSAQPQVDPPLRPGRAALGTSAESLTPADLIRAILRAPVDLLWNGGIGTYVGRPRSATPTWGTAQRRRADRRRGLRCRVVGEGGNLGLTQLARIEYARRGGRLDTDFIHNAGGVSCSDHEVNIKILLDQVVADGDMTLKQRNRLLEEMTDEVARLVLQDCYWQDRCHRARRAAGAGAAARACPLHARPGAERGS